MLILDTNHLDVLMQGGERAERLAERLQRSGEEVVTTIISVQEKAVGWLAAINSTKTKPETLPEYYRQLQQLIDFFKGWRILPFDEAALREFQRLRKQRIRTATLDLRIACIALCHQAVVLTRNTQDFVVVPNLRVEDWWPG